MYTSIEKPKDMLCGTACVHFVLSEIFNLNTEIPNNLSWAIDIASFLKTSTNLDYKIFCYNSNLYSDYLLEHDKKVSCGFEAISEYLSIGGTVITKKLSKRIITSMLKENFIIACVSSPVFNKDKNMQGGHFIVILASSKNKYAIANPKSDTIAIEIVSKRHIFNSLKNYGNWVIPIKRR